MTTTFPVADPLSTLPPEIVLRILEFAPVATLASLTAASKAWHRFIDGAHQEAIYISKTTQPPGGVRDLSFLSNATSYTKYFEGTSSWKDLCKRQTLLSRNWAASPPASRESVLQVGNDPVWRFRPDFKRRFFVSTSHAGGLNVTSMDTGRVIWRLPSTLDTVDGEDGVRPYAHLEYQDGMVVFDREGDAVEVWQAGLEGAQHGEFRRIAVLNHDCQTRGFQLSFWTLCVVSSEGQGFVYDMTQRPPKLRTHLQIQDGGIGHLDQSADVVIYSMGPRGFHAHDKTTGEFLGALHPSECTDMYHIRPPPAESSTATSRPFLPGSKRKDSLLPVTVAKGPLPTPTDPDHVWDGENEWGSGMINGNLFVGFSRAGRVFVCWDWRKALQSGVAAHSSIIECETDGSTFDLGGWLSVRNHRLMFEIQDRIYIVALDDDDRIQCSDSPARASYTLLTSSAPQLAVPVSFMGLYDDTIMSTYTTLGWRQPLTNLPGGQPPRQDNAARIFPTKAIRIVNLAPELSNKSDSPSDADQAQNQSTEGGGPQNPPAEEIWRSQAGLLQLINMLGGEFGELEEEDEGEDELEALFPDANNADSDGWEDDDDDDDDDNDHENTNQHPNEGV
ncbi:hypothetical protein BDW42DRAFT_171410 [Aspergillus taichungensis]|uniref:F-box domain-containing protein n=1 Tax=Aspergillus taichungensis TaxID=482145 RepID=A0A2J5HSA5_9EURO|nr:hypothetical protein BDW42DRAFT_171410 [Aspergillus taichungensis]